MIERFPHLIVAPVVLPLMTAALLLLLGQKRKRAKSIANVGAALAGLLVALEIMRGADAGGSSGAARVVLMSNWEAPFGIVLVADRLSALMLVLVGVVSLCAALYAEAAWGRAGAYFHALFQIQLMGLNGAFLTGDLFNLFVFFEVMLAASYGLHLHGSGWPRVRSGLHYIAVNLLASSLFLVGLAVLYGVMGTLSMADIAEKLALVPARDRGLLHAGAAVLAVAFLIKAAIWPLNAWLVPAYSATSAPVAALFALMTKVGIYVLMRSWTLFFSAGASAQFGGTVLLYAGLATIAFGAIGLMASMSLGHIAGFSVIVSSGTLLASLGTGTPAVTSAALFYMLSATLAVSALFLLVELVERIGSDGQRVPDLDVEPGEDTNLDDEEAPLVARAFPVSIALLGLAFMVCALLVAGLPPLSGFVAKISLLTALLSPRGGDPASTGAPVPPAAWIFFGLLLLSGLAATISLARAGIRYFWSSGGRLPPRLKAVEAASLLGLILCCTLLTLFAEPVLRTTSATAAGLHSPKAYIEAVLSMRPRPGPTRPVIEEEEAP
ncbi:monovalent cation/H+ antiporter subunit D [Sorangium sp. So ce887]|uniref:monovalent cation/H+ antiporter subunit D n=1 Tax=Sorangium sp. So ce887 TaxID=3133324 RepID=UPI003F645A38